MTSGYHNDQFFRIAQGGEEGITWYGNKNGSGYSLAGADNPEFVYPYRNVRVDGFQNDGTGINIRLKRGYVRNITEYLGGNSWTDVRKCQFQFNPTTLTQQIESSEGLNLLLQDPGQYSVPRATSVGFTFGLIFDRSYEMNNGDGSVVADGVNPWQQGDPSQVGVLRDLAALYGVIGQGVSASQTEFMKARLEDQLRAEASLSDSETAAADLETAISNVSGFVDANASNSAFLIPQPVRFMFSSLYVVEGFVRNVEVVFTKFNAAYVPMQCTVSINLEAKYIGFAQKNTFLQWSLEKRADLKIQEEKAEGDRISSIYAAFAKNAGKMKLELYYSSEALEDQAFPVFELLGTKGAAFKIKLDLPSASGAEDEIGQMFATSNPYIILSADATVYGPFNDLSNYRGPDLLGFAKANGRVLVKGKLNATYATNGSATTADEWDDMVNDGARSETFYTDNSAFDGPFTYDPDTSYYVLHYTGFVSGRVDGGERVKGEGSGLWIFGPGTNWSTAKTITLRWPDAPVEQTVGVQSGTVPADNAATAPPKAGGVSSVGGGGTRTGGGVFIQ